MSPIAIIALIIGIPALIGLIYIFVTGSTGLRRFIVTRTVLTVPMVFILATLVFFIMRSVKEPDAWQDDVLIAEMIGLARKTGDITRVPVSLPAMRFEQPNFWTALFGGLYLFRDLPAPAAITVRPRAELGALPIGQVMDLAERISLKHRRTSKNVGPGFPPEASF